MTQPTLQEYQEAIQRPDLCFQNPDLKHGKTIPGVFGLPKVISGGFAGVFQVKKGKTSYAARCFLRENDDTEKRYKIIYEFLHRKKINCIVKFDYIHEGILVKGKWYPILKMDWLEGDTLSAYVERNHNNREAMEMMASKFKELVRELHKRGISHGDLHDQNIMVVNGELKAIDYDAMYVPGLEGRDCSEVGHINYQHPERNLHHNGSYLDHFSEWVIYISLKALAKDPTIWKTVDGGDQCLLFRSIDYQDPDNSRAFKALSSINDDDFRILVDVFKNLLYTYNLDDIPSILDENKLIQTQHRLTSKAQYVPEISMGGLDVKYSSGDSSWIWENKKIDYIHFTGTGYFGLVSIMLPLLYILVVEGLFFLHMMPDGKPPLILLGVPVFALLFPVSYWMNTEVNQRRSMSAKLSKLENQTRVYRKKIEQELITINQYKSKLNVDIKKLREKIASQRNMENLELKKIESIHRNRLREIEEKEKKLQEWEKYEKSVQLKEKKERYLVEKLRGHRIRAARITNLGLIKGFLLSRQGIRSAADFTDVITIRNLFMGNGARFRLRAGGSIVFWWLDPEQVRAIREWQRDLIKRYEGKASDRLSKEETRSISEKYKAQQAQLRVDEKQVKDEVQEEKKKSREEYSKKREKLQHIIDDNKRRHDAVVAETQHNLNGICENISALDWEINNLKHQLKGYTEISFKNYVKQILGK